MKGNSLQNLISTLTCGDDQSAEQAAQAIAALGECALPALFDILDSREKDTRWWALRTLTLIQNSAVPAQLCRGLRDPEPEVRQCAALGLSQQPWGEAIPDLVEALKDEDALLSRLAGDALIACKDQAIPLLIDVLENGAAGAQIEAARALALIGGWQAIPALFNAWQDGSYLVQHWAEEGFERMGVGMQFFQPD
jgi:HEAT repeat protein